MSDPLPQLRLSRVACRDCGADLTGSNDGTGRPYCDNCDEGKDDEYVLIGTSDGDVHLAWYSERRLHVADLLCGCNPDYLDVAWHHHELRERT